MHMRENWSLSHPYTVGMISLILYVALLIDALDALRNLALAAFVAYLINPDVVYLTTHTRMDRVAAVDLVYFSAVVLLIELPATLLPIFSEEAQIIFRDLLDLSNQLGRMLARPIRVGGLVFHL